MLSLPDFNLPFVVEMNASGSGIGVVLMKMNKPIYLILVRRLEGELELLPLMFTNCMPLLKLYINGGNIYWGDLS